MEKRSNHYFIRDRALETLQALLLDLKSVLASALASLDADPQARGGLKPLPWRDNAIINLANIWHGIGKKVVVTPKSDFAEFCQYVFGAMGWPTDGLVSAIPDAVKKWRNHPKKFARLSK